MWWLVRFYLSMLILNYVFSRPLEQNKSEVNPWPFFNRQLRVYLEVGDTFTPREMLIIAEKLLKKVDEPGSGKGFVSSTYNPQELADKLFEVFFLTTKRIVVLEGSDVAGIDALQALAMSGEIVEDEQEHPVTEAASDVYKRGQIVSMEKRRCKYTLITKTVTEVPIRRGIKVASKLNKKRHLIVNQRRNNSVLYKTDTSQTSQRKNSSIINADTKESKTAKCRWKYICSNLADLDTCRLHSECGNKTSNASPDEISITRKSDEETPAIKQFRKMLGLFAVDEEVEKILESRYIRKRPPNAAAIEKVESLAEYFNKIIEQRNLASTTVASSDNAVVQNHVLIKKEKD